MLTLSSPNIFPNNLERVLHFDNACDEPIAACEVVAA